MSATVEDEQDVAVQYRPHHSKGRQKGPQVVKLMLTFQFFPVSRNIAIAFIILKIKWIWLVRCQSLENTNTLSLRQERLRWRVYPTARVESDLVRSTRRSSRSQHLLSMSATHWSYASGYSYIYLRENSRKQGKMSCQLRKTQLSILASLPIKLIMG